MSDYEIKNRNTSLNLMSSRLGLFNAPAPAPVAGDGVAEEAALHGLDHGETLLKYNGGVAQQDRMIKDKRRSLDRALKYSYQGAFIKKVDDTAVPWGFKPVGAEDKDVIRALINPNKLKPDYDDKIISVHYEHNFEPGDIFNWVGTNTYWLIYLQDLTELAYFRGNIKKCSHIISWQTEDGLYTTHAAIRGPVETKIDYIQKHGISVDNPNYSLNILLPKNKYTLDYFQRYSKFYLGDDELKVCWRVEAIDWLSMPGILEINAVEYYSNETEDDIENGIVGALIVEPENPNSESAEDIIQGETFIKPKKLYTYTYVGNLEATWSTSGEEECPVQLVQDGKTVQVRWLKTYSGQFDLIYGDAYKKTIVVESLF